MPPGADSDGNIPREEVAISGALKRHDDMGLSYLEAVPSGRPAEGMPLVVVLHGRGSDASDLAELAPVMDGSAPFRFLFPDAPGTFEIYPGFKHGFSWFEGWPPSGASFGKSGAQLMEFLDGAQKKYGVTDGKTVLMGFSQGGLMSVDVGFRRKEPLAGIVVMSGALHEEDMPDFAARRQQPIIVVHGSYDDVIPVRAAQRLRSVLMSHALDPEYEEFPMGHHVTEESMKRVKEFLERVTKKSEG